MHDDSGRPKREMAAASMDDKAAKTAAPSSKRLRSSSNGREPTSSKGTKPVKAIAARRTKQPQESAKSPRKTASTSGRVKDASTVTKRGENGVSHRRPRVRNISNSDGQNRCHQLELSLSAQE
jgi:hypothetical protein